MRVGQFIKAWREKRDLTVRDAAPLLGVSIATLSRIERGGQIDADTQIKLIIFLFGSGNRSSQEHATAMGKSAAPENNSRTPETK